MARYVEGLLAVLFAAIAVDAVAQQQMLTPSEVLGCLTPAEATRGTPVYPETRLARKEGARVAVELEFRAADEAPKVTVTERDVPEDFISAVREHVRRYRVPCLKPEQTARLSQNFEFVPTDGRKVRWQWPVDAADARRLRLALCIKHPRPGTKPEYPQFALRDNVQGPVILRLLFSAADAPPAIEVANEDAKGALQRAALDFAKDFRMPCHEGEPVSVTQFYIFRIQDSRRVVLRDMTLLTLLSSVKGIQQANVYFDFRQMACPFELRFSLNQPYALNAVGELGEHHPERRHFIDWLSRQQLDLPERTLSEVIGDKATVTVPCTVLNLGTASGGGASQ